MSACHEKGGWKRKWLGRIVEGKWNEKLWRKLRQIRKREEVGKRGKLREKRGKSSINIGYIS